MVVVILITLSWNIQVSAKIKKTFKKNENYLLENVAVSKNDFKLGENIALLLEGLKDNDINQRLLKKLRKSRISKKSAFYGIAPWLKRVYNIQYVKDTKNLIKYCPFEKKEKAGNLLNKKLDELCLKTYFDLVVKKYKRKKVISSFDEKIYAKNIGKILSKSFRPYHYNFLDRLKDAPTEFVSIIESEYLNSNIQVDPRIVSRIEASQNLTNHIQKNGIQDYRVNKLYREHLNDLYKQVNYKIRNEIKIGIELKTFMGFYLNNKNKFKEHHAYNIFKKLWKTLLNKGLYEDAKQILGKAQELFIYKEKEVLFYLVWVNIIDGEYDGAYKVVQENKLLANFSDLSPRFQFWISYTLEEIGDMTSAKKYYSLLTRDNELDFYVIMGEKKLAMLKFDYINAKNAKSKKQIVQKINLSKKHLTKSLIRSFKRLNIWSSLNHNALIKNEIEYLTSLGREKIISRKYLGKYSEDMKLKGHVTLSMAKLLSKKENYLNSFIVIFKGLSSDNLTASRSILKTLFPNPYIKEIKKHVKNVDPLIFLSLIRQESAFDPKAISYVGARGLMQLMPATAKQVYRKISSRQLSNPKTNLKIGIKYFNRLLKKYDGNLIYSLAAYNAGETALKRWRRTIFKDKSVLHTIESIPYFETRKYVQYIFRNIYFYKALYSNEKDSTKIDHLFDIPVMNAI